MKIHLNICSYSTSFNVTPNDDDSSEQAIFALFKIGIDNRETNHNKMDVTKSASLFFIPLYMVALPCENYWNDESAMHFQIFACLKIDAIHPAIQKIQPDI